MAVDVQAASLGPAGRSNNVDFAAGYFSSLPYNTPINSSGSHSRLKVLTSTKSLGYASRAGSGSSPSSTKSYKQNGLRPTLRNIDTNMSSYTQTTTIPASTTRSDSRLVKLHKRGSSGSSLPANPSPLSGAHTQFTTPFATYEEPFPDISSTPPQSSTPKIKPYLRKLSSAREDENQGRLDLSKSVSENGALAGLGIQDFGTRSSSDVNFSQTGRRTPHTRTTSTGSQISTGSGSFKPTPFIHPMRQTPNTPTPTRQSLASSLNDDDVQESSDIVTDDDVQIGQTFRNHRSGSISSFPQIQPTPLSQSYTAHDLGAVPKLTSSSQTNLSMKSGRSAKSSKSKLGRPRRHTDRSEYVPSPSSRTSLDKTAFSFVPRRSDPDPATRDERIRAARRKFEEKEADKDRKMEKEALKRRDTEEAKSAKKQERQRRKSEASQSERAKISKPNRKGSEDQKSKRDKNREKQADEMRSRSYNEYSIGHITALPSHKREPGISEKTSQRQQNSSEPTESAWARFIRVLSCGGTS